MSTPDISGKQNAGMHLRVAFFHWAVCLGAFIILLLLAINFSSATLGWFTFIWYVAAGLHLNRRILRKLITWHPVYNTLYNVTSAKLRLFLFWPFSYFFLFVRLGINKVL